MNPKQVNALKSGERSLKEGGSQSEGGSIVPLKYIEYGVYGDLIIIYPKPYSIYLRGTIILESVGLVPLGLSPGAQIWLSA